jgi:dihydropyrimidinase
MLDIVIRGDQVVTPWEVGAFEIGIQGEKIVTVQSPGTLTEDAKQVIDAKGKIVIPGGIESHAHLSQPFPEWGKVTGPVDQATCAAIWGGTTTVLDFAVQEPQNDLWQALEERKKAWQGESYTDYYLRCAMRGTAPKDILPQIGEVIKAGFPCIKVYTCTVRPPAGCPKGLYRTVHPNPAGSYRMDDTGYIWAIMKEVVANGGLLMVHAEDQDIVMYMYERMEMENRMEFHNVHLVHNNLSEDISFRKIIRLAEWTGAAICFAHVSAKEGVLAIEEARRKDLPVYGETIQLYATFTSEDYKRPDGQKYHNYPSTKSAADREALWDGLIKGSISFMGTDHVGTSLDMKLRGKTILDVAGGTNGIETRVGITYTEGVVKRGMSLKRFVDVVSSNVAKLFGIYPRKGAIAPGSDADIVFIDPNFRKKLTLNDLHSYDYNIYEGWEVSGWPVFTMVRGKVLLQDRKLMGNKGYGQLIHGKISPEIIVRPMC